MIKSGNVLNTADQIKPAISERAISEVGVSLSKLRDGVGVGGGGAAYKAVSIQSNSSHEQDTGGT